MGIPHRISTHFSTFANLSICLFWGCLPNDGSPIRLCLNASQEMSLLIVHKHTNLTLDYIPRIKFEMGDWE